MRRPGAALAAAVTLGLASCGTGGAAEPPPDVVLLVLDTLRADHLSCYGYERATSPNLDAFAAGAVLYENAVSTAPWTLPSHGSLFTGLLPFQHGAITKKTGSKVRPVGLGRKPATLAELLGEAGYESLGFAANVAFLREDYGLARGFDSWMTRRVLASQLMPRMLARADQTWEQGGEVFLFGNFLDTHRPYNAGGRPHFAPEATEQESVELLDSLYETVLVGTEPADSARLERIRDLYDASIANLDAALGTFFDGLRERGRFDPSLIAVTSDHGEAFGEHDVIEHSKHVIQPLLHVPLIVKEPGRTLGERRAERIGLAQVPGLLLGFLPNALAVAGPRHRALLEGPRVDGEPLIAAENHFSRARDVESSAYGARFDVERWVVFEGRWKWVAASAGEPALFDLAVDPGELAPRSPSGEDPRLGERWSRALTELRVFVPGGAVTETEATRQALEELGYF